jgi:hypothetical protein
MQNPQYPPQLLRLLSRLSLEDVEDALLHLYQENPSPPQKPQLRELSTREWEMLQTLLTDLLLEAVTEPLH